MKQLLHRPESVDVVMDILKFSKTPVSEGFSLVFKVEKNECSYVVLKAQNERFILNKKTNLSKGERIKLYYKIKDRQQEMACLQMEKVYKK